MNSSIVSTDSPTRTDDNFNMRDMIVKFSLTQAEILAAVKIVGPDKTRVEEYLSARK